MNYIAVSGHKDGESIVISDGFTNWQLVAVDGSTAIFEAIEHRELGYEPRTRIIANAVIRQIFGWIKRDTHTRPSYLGFGIEVYCDDERHGFGLAEPIWYRRENDPIWADLERDRNQRMWDRDCDRAANFEMSFYGNGSVL